MTNTDKEIDELLTLIWNLGPVPEAKAALTQLLNSEVEKAKKELNEALVALGNMYGQYCGPNFGHDFMGAGEYAIEILEKHGLGNERDGQNDILLDKLEAQLNQGEKK